MSDVEENEDVVMEEEYQEIEDSFRCDCCNQIQEEGYKLDSTEKNVWLCYHCYDYFQYLSELSESELDDEQNYVVYKEVYNCLCECCRKIAYLGYRREDEKEFCQKCVNHNYLRK